MMQLFMMRAYLSKCKSNGSLPYLQMKITSKALLVDIVLFLVDKKLLFAQNCAYSLFAYTAISSSIATDCGFLIFLMPFLWSHSVK